MSRKIIISLAPVKAGTPIDKIALAEDVKNVWKKARVCAISTAAARMAA